MTRTNNASSGPPLNAGTLEHNSDVPSSPITQRVSAPYSAVDPRAHLARLEDVPMMDDDERQAALAQWVAWFNAHRDIVTPQLEKQIDEALGAFDAQRERVLPERLQKLQGDFDRWIESLPWPM